MFFIAIIILYSSNIINLKKTQLNFSLQKYVLRIKC